MMTFSAIHAPGDDTPGLRQLIASSLDLPSAESVNQILLAYSSLNQNYRLFAAKYNNILVGSIGIELHTSQSAVINFICVLPDIQWKGVGRFMVIQLGAVLDLQSVEVYSNREEVGFYKSCGFIIREYAEEKNRPIRFHCLWEYDEKEHKMY